MFNTHTHTHTHSNTNTKNLLRHKTISSYQKKSFPKTDNKLN